jgi:hypothetical protein
VIAKQRRWPEPGEEIAIEDFDDAIAKSTMWRQPCGLLCSKALLIFSHLLFRHLRPIKPATIHARAGCRQYAGRAPPIRG